MTASENVIGARPTTTLIYNGFPLLMFTQIIYRLSTHVGFKGERNGEHIRGARERRGRVPSFFLLAAPALVFDFNFPLPFSSKRLTRG